MLQKGEWRSDPKKRGSISSRSVPERELGSPRKDKKWNVLHTQQNGGRKGGGGEYEVLKLLRRGSREGKDVRWAGKGGVLPIG